MDEKTITRFWKKVDKNGPVVRESLDECWLWLGTATPAGYGMLNVTGERIPSYAHRVSWEIDQGHPAGELLVCHRCDNPRCVRPSHLFVGTSKDNVADCVAKGRLRPGVHPGAVNGRAKLTDIVVLAIRERVAGGERQADVGRDLGVPKVTVNHIVKRRTWAHI